MPRRSREQAETRYQQTTAQFFAQPPNPGSAREVSLPSCQRLASRGQIHKQMKNSQVTLNFGRNQRLCMVFARCAEVVAGGRHTPAHLIWSAGQVAATKILCATSKTWATRENHRQAIRSCILPSPSTDTTRRQHMKIAWPGMVWPGLFGD